MQRGPEAFHTGSKLNVPRAGQSELGGNRQQPQMIHDVVSMLYQRL